jgi:hypothetical protein
MAAYVTLAMVPWRSLRSKASAATFAFYALVGAVTGKAPTLAGRQRGEHHPRHFGWRAACSPQRLPAFVPLTNPARVCTAAQIKAYYDACWVFTGDAGSQCTDFVGDPANSPCIDCVLTPAGATKYGATFTYPDGTTPNTSGCIALVDGDTSPNGCGATLASVCQKRACQACSFHTYTDCFFAAPNSPTRGPFAQSASCAIADKYFACFFADWQSTVRGLALIFCAASVAGGSDAPPGCSMKVLTDALMPGHWRRAHVQQTPA